MIMSKIFDAESTTDEVPNAVRSAATANLSGSRSPSQICKRMRGKPSLLWPSSSMVYRTLFSAVPPRVVERGDDRGTFALRAAYRGDRVCLRPFIP